MCVDLSLPPIPTVPDILLPSPALVTPFPIGVPLPCCKFQVAIPAVDAAIAASNAAMAALVGTLGAGFAAAVFAVNEQIAVVQAQVNKVRMRIPDCPCNGTTLTPP